MKLPWLVRFLSLVTGWKALAVALVAHLIHMFYWYVGGIGLLREGETINRFV